MSMQRIIILFLMHAMYDVPGKSSDNMEMFDASDEVYEYLVCSICPVSLSKAGLVTMQRQTVSRIGYGTGCGYAGQRIFIPGI